MITNIYRKPKKLDKLNKQKIEYTLNSKFGLLQPIEYIGINIKNEHACYKCKCDCGNEVIMSRSNLKIGRVSSCGCFLKQKKDKSRHWKGCGDISSSLFCHIKTGAIRRSIEFNITIEYVWDLFLKQDKRCKISGVAINFQSEAKKYDGTASLDRIDSSKGYIEGNVQWVHKKINIMKQNNSDEQFIEWCNIISNYQKTI